MILNVACHAYEWLQWSVATFAQRFSCPRTTTRPFLIMPALVSGLESRGECHTPGARSRPQLADMLSFMQDLVLTHPRRPHSTFSKGFLMLRLIQSELCPAPSGGCGQEECLEARRPLSSPRDHDDSRSQHHCAALSRYLDLNYLPLCKALQVNSTPNYKSEPSCL